MLSIAPSQRVAGICLFTSLLACEEPKPPVPPPLVVLQELTASPSCFVEPPALVLEGLSERVKYLRETARRRRDAQAQSLAFVVEWARILTAPVVASPEGESWMSGDADRYVEVARTAGGAEWTEMEAVFVETRNGARFSVNAEITAAPGRTLIDFGDRELDTKPQSVRLEAFIRGCELETGRSFEIGPNVVDGEIQDDVLDCWPKTMIPSDASEQTKIEIAAQDKLRCVQSAEKVIRG